MFRQRAQLLLSRTLSVATTVVATSDYVSPNKTTDCCGIINVIGTNHKEYNNYNPVNDDNCTEKRANSSSISSDKGSSSYSFNNDKNDKENDLYKLAASLPSGNNGTSLSTTSLHPPWYPPLHPPSYPPLHPPSYPPLHPPWYPPLHPPWYPPLHPPSYPPLHPPWYPPLHQLYPHQPYQPYKSYKTDRTANDATANDSLFHRTSNSDCIGPQKGSGAITTPMVTTGVLPDRTYSSTSEAMWMLAPPSTSVLEEEFASSSIAEEFGLGDHDGDDQLPHEFWFDKLQDIIPDSNISNSTMNVPTSTTQKGKRKQNSTWDFTGGEYVEPSDDCQDFSKSHGLVYSMHASSLRLSRLDLQYSVVPSFRFIVVPCFIISYCTAASPNT